MATLYGTVAAKQNAPTNKDPLYPIETLPNTRKLLLTYVMTGDEVAADIVRLYKLPPGCIVLPKTSTVTGDAVATTATITVGLYDLDGVVIDADKYSTALDVAAAGSDTFTGGAAATTPYTNTVEAWLTFTFATLGTPVAGKKLDFYVDVNFPA